MLYHTSLHACVLNTAALREAGFADRQPDPPGGAFGRDGEGRLDGVVYEAPMFALFERNLRRDIARMGAGARAGLVRTAGQRLAALGLTAACDADMRRDTFAAFAEADAAGLLSQRIYGLVVHDQVDWLLGAGLRGRHSGRLATEAVKIWADGGMSSRTAAIHGTYPVPPHGSGILYFERDELTEMVRDFDARGFQVCIHAQGDRAIETVLDAYAAVLAGRRGQPAPAPHRARRRDVPAAGRPGRGPGDRRGEPARIPVRPGRRVRRGVRRSQRRALLLRLLAAGRHHRRGLLRRTGHHAPIPCIGIRDAILRRTSDGRVLGPAERLPARDALALYTTQAAFACHRESETGSLEPGKLADFVVLDEQPARGRTRADPRHPGAGHRRRRNPRLPIRRHLPRPLTGPGLLSKEPATAPAQGLRQRACAPGHRGPPSSAAPASRVPANGQRQTQDRTCRDRGNAGPFLVPAEGA